MIRNALKLTGGNLSVHLKKLEKGGLISIKKSFVNAKPQTVAKITDKGKKAIKEYASDLFTIIQTTADHL